MYANLVSISASDSSELVSLKENKELLENYSKQNKAVPTSCRAMRRKSNPQVGRLGTVI
jgi:hypothetical protein